MIGHCPSSFGFTDAVLVEPFASDRLHKLVTRDVRLCCLVDISARGHSVPICDHSSALVLGPIITCAHLVCRMQGIEDYLSLSLVTRLVVDVKL